MNDRGLWSVKYMSSVHCMRKRLFTYLTAIVKLSLPSISPVSYALTLVEEDVIIIHR
jgi:hypothetical protein